MKKILSWLIALAVLWTGFLTIYAAVQQAQRNDANSPQIQMAEDTAALLKARVPDSVLPGQKVDMATSLAPFTIIYDKKGNVVVGSGYLNGKIPKAPIGILQASSGPEYNAVTWEPADNVRIAAVTTSANDYYVLSGRNLEEVEKNENKTLEIVLFGGLFATLLVGAAYFVQLVLPDDETTL